MQQPAARFNIVLVYPPGYTPAEGLVDVCRLLYFSFESLGYSVTFQKNALEADAINVVVGYHLVEDAAVFGNHRIILFQLEQLSEAEGWYSPRRLEVLRRAEQVWDYSAENVRFLADRGIGDVRVLPFGFHEKLRTIAPAAKDIDVLFYGSVNPRRGAVLEQLQKRCRLRAVFGAYGPTRDAIIARSRIILNVHFYEAQILEVVRISYLVNNGCMVVSEESASNPFAGMIVTSPLEKLVETCLGLLADEGGMARVAAEGLRLFSERPMTKYLREVLK
jgi:hypothetical protein